ncbi:TVP38/TMEM64 family protein [Prochlorococcus marinus]|uniref:TVP38/TMEM64 family protein n=1 Tax=Prochlorococcus marinus TaxID=1219 RepID=UPI0022B4A1B2|nr:VTT domain-containing protein [Prochlorococcus marinus]
MSTPLGIIVFILFYAIWVNILLPGSWLSMFAGLVYGSLLGSIFVFIGAFLGAITTFVLVRTFLRHWINKRLDSFPKLQLIVQSITSEGLKLIILTRLSPAFPFGLLNLGYALTKVSFKDFTIGLVAIFPGTLLYCSLGSLAGEISKFDSIISNSSQFNFLTLIGTFSTALALFLVLRSVRNSSQSSS